MWSYTQTVVLTSGRLWPASRPWPPGQLVRLHRVPHGDEFLAVGERERHAHPSLVIIDHRTKNSEIFSGAENCLKRREVQRFTLLAAPRSSREACSPRLQSPESLAVRCHCALCAAGS